jgi:hypothetical protein
MDDDNPFSKAQTVDPEVKAYVYSLVNAVGERLTPMSAYVCKMLTTCSPSSVAAVWTKMDATSSETTLLPAFET